MTVPLYRIEGQRGKWITIGPAPCSCGQDCYWFRKEPNDQRGWRAFSMKKARKVK